MYYFSLLIILKIVVKGRSEPSLDKLGLAIKYLNDQKKEQDELNKKIKECIKSGFKKC